MWVILILCGLLVLIVTRWLYIEIKACNMDRILGSFSERIYQQSEILSKRAEKDAKKD